MPLQPHVALGLVRREIVEDDIDFALPKAATTLFMKSRNSSRLGLCNGGRRFRQLPDRAQRRGSSSVPPSPSALAMSKLLQLA
jgi:hypothetical protein